MESGFIEMIYSSEMEKSGGSILFSWLKWSLLFGCFRVNQLMLNLVQ